MRAVPQLGLPVPSVVGNHQLVEDEFDDAVQEGRLVGDVPVERHGLAAQLPTEPTPGQCVQAFSVDESQRGHQHPVAGEGYPLQRWF